MKVRSNLKRVLMAPLHLGVCIAVLATFSIMVIRSNKDNKYE